MATRWFTAISKTSSSKSYGSCSISSLSKNATIKGTPGCEGISLNTLAYFHPIEPWWQKIKTAIRKELPTYNFHVPQAAEAAYQTW